MKVHGLERSVCVYRTKAPEDAMNPQQSQSACPSQIVVSGSLVRPSNTTTKTAHALPNRTR